MTKEEVARELAKQKPKTIKVEKAQRITNGDRIRAMSDEELTNYLICVPQAVIKLLINKDLSDYKQGILEYLKSEVK